MVYLYSALAALAFLTLGYQAGAHDVGWRAATWRRRHRTPTRRPVTDMPLPDTEPAKETAP